MDLQIEEQLASSRRTITVLIPCYNEQESLPLLFERMEALVLIPKVLSTRCCS